MADVSEAIFSVVKDGLNGERLYPTQAPDKALPPYAVYLEVAQPVLNTLKGPSKTQQHLIQFESYAKTKLGAKALSQKIDDAMLAEKLNPDASPPGRFTATKHGGRDDYDPETKLYLYVTEWSVWTR